KIFCFIQKCKHPDPWLIENLLLPVYSAIGITITTHGQAARAPALMRILFTRNDIDNGHENDADIQHRCPIFEIPNVMCHTALHEPRVCSFTAVPIDLRPASDTWLEELTGHIVVNDSTVLFGMLEHVRA